MNRFLLLTVALIMLIFACANAQLIGEGDTLWYKSLYPNTISHVQLSPDGTKLGVVINDNNIIMFDALSGDSLWSRIFNTRIYKFTVSQSGTSIWVNNALDSELVEIDLNNGQIFNKYRYKNPVSYYDMVFSTPNPNIFLMTNHAQSFALYDIEKGVIIKEQKISDISKYAVSPNSKYFIRAYQYETNNNIKTKINLYDINTLDFVATLGEEEGLVNAGEAKISYNGKFAATNFGGRALQIWDLENKKLFKEYTPTIPTDSTSGRGGQTALAFCHNNENLINSGGKHISYTSPSSTSINNFLNNKRAIIFKEKNFTTLDVTQDDLYFVGGQYTTFYVLKLHLDAVSVDEMLSSSNDIIYPNPTTGSFTINIPQNFGIINSGQIFDNSGKIVKTYLPNELLISESKLTLNLNDIRNGVYILKLTSANDILTYKIILEK
jgi:hypothetical protein